MGGGDRRGALISKREEERGGQTEREKERAREREKYDQKKRQTNNRSLFMRGRQKDRQDLKLWKPHLQIVKLA